MFSSGLSSAWPGDKEFFKGKTIKTCQNLSVQNPKVGGVRELLDRVSPRVSFFLPLDVRVTNVEVCPQAQALFQLLPDLTEVEIRMNINKSKSKNQSS